MFQAETYIQEYRQLEAGAPRLRALKKAIQAADEAGNAEWSFRFRDRYIRESTFENDCVDALVMFPEMLALYDGSEELQADEDCLHSVLWDFKWILSDAPDFAHIPLEQIESLFAEFRKRLEANGKSLRPYYYLRETLSEATGNLLPPEEYGKYRELPVDDLKDCTACEANHDVQMALLLDRVADAEKYAAPIFSGELQCAEVPERTLGHWIEYDIRKGNYAHAKKLARQLYPMIKNEIKMLELSGVLLHLYAVVDRQTGCNVFRHELKHFMKSRLHYAKYVFASGAYRLFDKMQMDTITLILPQDFPLWNEKHRYQSAALRDYFYEQAETLAKRLDARNGNTRRMDALQAEDVAYDEEAIDLIHGEAEQLPSVIGAVCTELPETLTTESVTESIARDGRFKVMIAQATEEGLLAFQIADGDGDDSEIYQLMLVCQPVPPVQEFRPASPIADGVFEAASEAEGVVMCIMPFEEKQPDLALHFQLKILHLLFPAAVAYLDYSRMKLLPAGWVALEAVSDVPPLVDYLYNLQLRGDENSEYLWISTQGLRCCGMREMQVMDATKENFPRYCDMLCFTVEKMLLRDEMPDANTPFTVIRKQDNAAVVCTWIPTAEAKKDYPESDAAGMRLRLMAGEREDEDAQDDAVLYLYDGEAADGSVKRKRLNAITMEEFDSFCYGSYIATSRKIAALAQERIGIFQSLMERYPENAYVCAYFKKDSEEDEVWLKATLVTEEEITGILVEDCLVGKQGDICTLQHEQLTDFSVRLDENLVVHPNTAYIGLEIE